MGSSQSITDTFLAFIREIFWKEGPPKIADAIFSVTWTLDLAIKINPGGVNGPITVAVLKQDKSGHFAASLLSEDELAETHQNAAAMREHIGAFKAQQSPDAYPPDLPSK
ncbi:MAG: hypothetical protein ABSC55_01400 [Syntrophorhabdales bacterium]|jgi:hypothetical protein